MSKQDKKPRTHLPMRNTAPALFVSYDAKDPDTVTTPIEQLRPPEGAPNVLIVLIDDCGFGAPSTFGGPCAAPFADKLAAGGLRYNRFHTTAICSATRRTMCPRSGPTSTKASSILAGTLMAVDPDARKVERFVTLGGEARLVRYNNRLPQWAGRSPLDKVGQRISGQHL